MSYKQYNSVHLNDHHAWDGPTRDTFFFYAASKRLSHPPASGASSRPRKQKASSTQTRYRRDKGPGWGGGGKTRKQAQGEG